MCKYIKIIHQLIEKAEEKGTARINGRMSLGYGYKGKLEEKYSVDVKGDIVSLWHWGTHTLEINKATKEILHFYGESNSDRDSMNNMLSHYGFSERFRYRPSLDLFELVA